MVLLWCSLWSSSTFPRVAFYSRTIFLVLASAWGFLACWRVVSTFFRTLALHVDTLSFFFYHPSCMWDLQVLMFFLSDNPSFSLLKILTLGHIDFSILGLVFFSLGTHLHTPMAIVSFIMHMLEICPIFP